MELHALTRKSEWHAQTIEIPNLHYRIIYTFIILVFYN